MSICIHLGDFISCPQTKQPRSHACFFIVYDVLGSLAHLYIYIYIKKREHVASWSAVCSCTLVVLSGFSVVFVKQKSAKMAVEKLNRQTKLSPILIDVPQLLC